MSCASDDDCIVNSLFKDGIGICNEQNLCECDEDFDGVDTFEGNFLVL